jgi:hypothetical protein
MFPECSPAKYHLLGGKMPLFLKYPILGGKMPLFLKIEIPTPLLKIDNNKTPNMCNNMTFEHFHSFKNICAEHSWYVLASNGQKVEFDDFEEIRKEAYPYDSRVFADYIATVHETLRNEEAKIMDSCMGVPIYPHHAGTTHQRTAFLQWFQDIYAEICTQGYSPMSISESDTESNTDNDSDSDSNSDSEEFSDIENDNDNESIDAHDFDEIRRLLMFDDEQE